MWDFFQEVVFILMSLTWTLFEGGLKYGNLPLIRDPHASFVSQAKQKLVV